MADLIMGKGEGGGPCDMDEATDSPVVSKEPPVPSAAVAEGLAGNPHSVTLKRFKGRRGQVSEDLGQENRDSSLAIMQSFQDYLHECCKLGLPMDHFVLQQAVELFRKIKCPLMANLDSTEGGRGVEPIWGACVLYLVKRLGAASPAVGEKNGSCFTLSQLLRITRLSVVEFFKELAQFFVKVGSTVKSLFGDDCERRLQIRESQTNFVHLVVLFNYYKRVYQDYFLSLESATETWNGSKFSISMQFGWMLFLVMRMRVLPQFTDLVTCTNGLLAVMTIMILHMPAHLKKVTCEDTSKFGVRTAGGVNVIASLCHLYHASEKDVSDMVENAGKMIQEVFQKSEVALSALHMKQVLGLNAEGLPYFDAFMEDVNLEAHIQVFESDYDAWHKSQGELDERAFIREDDTLIGAMSVSSLSASGVKRKFDVMSSPNHTSGAYTVVSPLGAVRSPCSSPLKGESAAVATGKMPPPTPVSTTMTTAKWFRTVIAPLPSEPSAELQQAFRSCDQDVSDNIRSRLQALTGSIFPSTGPGNSQAVGEVKGGALMDSTWAEQRRLEVTKLYYKVLGAMCRSEARRQPTCNLTALLTNEKFHRCMIACSAELVLATHKTVTITFSAVLESTGITAFDLSKVIEGFVRYEETLPRELKRHLNSLEERLLESMAWEKGSSMYTSLVVAKASLSAEISRLCLLPEPQPPLDVQSSATVQHPIGMASVDDVAGSPPRQGVSSAGKSVSAIMSSVGELGISSLRSPAKERTSAFSAFASPVKGRMQPSIHSQFASPRRPGSLGGGETCAEIVINVFFQKVLKLAANRIRSLCERLQLSTQIMDHVYSTMRQMLHRGTSVFFNRHIDQLILCSIYGVCKVSRVNVTFRDIIFQYRKQPQCKPHVFRNVFIDSPVGRRTENPGGPGTGDVIRFYNEVFVPAAKGFLMPINQKGSFSPSAGEHVDSNDKCNGKLSEASEPSTFPALPNMSPKKVSATHNVYVSPLRGMKMDFIMSPHTRSLYACVGESTHEFQSPSRDLSAINSRLNSRRLDFSDIAPVRDRNAPAATPGSGAELASLPSGSHPNNP